MTVESKSSKILKIIICDIGSLFHFFTLICALIALLYDPSLVLSDARVDGFYDSDFVRSGYFKDKEFAKAANVDTQDSTQYRKKFFISRQERLANPERAPSNNIKIPQTTIRVSNRIVCLPGFGNCSETLIVYPINTVK